jgi:hypothetical protein
MTHRKLNCISTVLGNGIASIKGCEPFMKPGYYFEVEMGIYHPVDNKIEDCFIFIKGHIWSFIHQEIYF